MAGRLVDTLGPETCHCGREWVIRKIELKVGDEIIEAGRYWCRACDVLHD